MCVHVYTYLSSPPPHMYNTLVQVYKCIITHTIYPAKDVGVTHYRRVAWIRRSRSLRVARRSSSAIITLHRDGFPVHSHTRYIYISIHYIIYVCMCIMYICLYVCEYTSCVCVDVNQPVAHRPVKTKNLQIILSS